MGFGAKVSREKSLLPFSTDSRGSFRPRGVRCPPPAWHPSVLLTATPMFCTSSVVLIFLSTPVFLQLLSIAERDALH